MSLVVHASVVSRLLPELTPRPDEPRTLVVELKGVIAERQVEQKLQQESRQEQAEVRKPAKASAAKHPSQHIVVAQPSPPPAETRPARTDADDGPRAEERQDAQTIKMDRDKEADRLRDHDYARRLQKRIQTNLTYPDELRQAGPIGTVTVSFTILQTGQIRPETLRVAASSGQPKLDANALKAVRSSAPLDPPPREITVAIPLYFGPLR